MTLTLPDMDVVVFDETILSDEPPCEFEHTKTVCSEHVTHKILYCASHFLICLNAAKSRSELIMRRPNSTCADCKKPISECWAVFPV
jgi:hypothetical protein